jgi:hypothetical protein
MNAAHLHLMLNHVPVVGTLIVLPLLAWAIHRRSAELLRVVLATFVAIGVAGAVVYLTGEPAEEVVEHLAGVVHTSIEAHEDAARVSLRLTGGLGLLGLVGLWRLRAGARTPRWLVVSAVAGAMVVMISLGWTASLGGLIRHPEAAVDFVAPRTE